MSVQICPECHSMSFTFNRERHAIVCSVCGWVRNGNASADEMFAYDQARVRAVALIRARDYASAQTSLGQMYNARPDDPDIYYLHLMGLTDCCRDLLLEPTDEAKSRQVQNYWNTLQSLGGDGRIFVPYFRRRNLELKKRREKDLTKAGLLALACYIPFLAFVSASASGYAGLLIPAIAVFLIIVTKQPLINLFRLMSGK